MKELFKKKIVRFLITGAAIYVGWLLLYELVIRPYTPIDYYVNYNLAQISQAVLGWFGEVALIDIESDHVVLLLDTNKFRPVLIGDECNGLKLFAIFSLLIILLPGNRKSKFWFIPMGMVIVHLVNAFRVMMLLIIADRYPTWLDFNHKYTFILFVYGVIMLLWIWWAKKYGKSES